MWVRLETQRARVAWIAIHASDLPVAKLACYLVWTLPFRAWWNLEVEESEDNNEDNINLRCK